MTICEGLSRERFYKKIIFRRKILVERSRLQIKELQQFTAHFLLTMMILAAIAAF